MNKIRLKQSSLRFAYLACALATGLVLVREGSLLSAPEPSWLTSPLALDTLADNISTTDLPYRTNGNRDCQQMLAVTRPKKVTIAWPFIQDEQTKPACVIGATFGAVDEQGYLQREGTGVTGLVKNTAGVQAVIVAVPRTPNLLVFDKSAPGNTVYMYLYRNVAESLKTSVSLDGSVIHHLTASPSTSLQDVSGKLVGIQPDSLSFSASGRWVVTDIPGVGMSRIDLNDMKITPFARWPIGYDSSAPNYQTAISGSGRYVVVSSASYKIFKVFDLNTCSKTVLAMYEQCQYTDLQTYMSRSIQNFFGASRIRFMNEGDLDFYGTRKQGATVLNGHYSLYLPDQPKNFGYLALGDSFSSGEGAFDYKLGTDIHENKCHLSLKSYPFVLGSELGLSSYDSVACSGAKINNMQLAVGISQLSSKKENMYDQEILSDFLPGYRSQTWYIQKKLPSVITLSAGGNDIGFSDIIKRCVGPDTCYQYQQEREQLLTLIDAQFDRLVSLYTELQAAGGIDRMQVYVVGYPQIAQPEGNCAANVHLNKGELYFANELIDYLNSIVKQASAKAGVYYVDATHAFDGHRFCETDSWNVAVNGLTKGNDIPNISNYSIGPIANESFHPNQLGQWLLAQAVKQQTSGLSVVMPKPDPTVQLNKNHDQLSMITHAPTASETFIPQQSPQYYSAGPETMYYNQPTELTTDADSPVFAPETNVDVELRSTPTILGTFTTNSRGDLAAHVTVPSSIAKGLHTLHLFGKNVAGEDVDLFRTVYVNSAVPGSDSQCVVVPDSGQDVDKDMVDDACDAFIGQVVVAQQPAELSPSEKYSSAQVQDQTYSEPTHQEVKRNSTTAQPSLSQNVSASTSGLAPRVLGGSFDPPVKTGSSASKSPKNTATQHLVLGGVAAVLVSFGLTRYLYKKYFV